jgi:hypothetical protein
MVGQGSIVGDAYDAEALPRLYERVADLEELVHVDSSGKRTPYGHKYFVWQSLARGLVPVFAHAMWTGATYRLSAEAFMGTTLFLMALRVGAMSFKADHDPFGEPWQPASRAAVREAYERWQFRHGLDEDWSPLREWIERWFPDWSDANPLPYPLYFLSIQDLDAAEQTVRDAHKTSTKGAPAPKRAKPVPETVQPPDRLTSKELAVRLRLSEQRIREWRTRGKGPRYQKLEGGHVRYLIEDVERWEREQAAPGYDDKKPGRRK